MADLHMRPTAARRPYISSTAQRLEPADRRRFQCDMVLHNALGQLFHDGPQRCIAKEILHLVGVVPAIE